VTVTHEYGEYVDLDSCEDVTEAVNGCALLAGRMLDRLAHELRTDPTLQVERVGISIDYDRKRLTSFLILSPEA
jgi:hypothetical protein